MSKITDNYIHENIAKDIYDKIVDKFSLEKYKSICCFDSKINRNEAFDYKTEVDFLFSQHLDVEKVKHHFYINSFRGGARPLGLHAPNTDNALVRTANGEFMTTEKTEANNKVHYLFLMCPRGSTSGGDFYFGERESSMHESCNRNFSKVSFKHNRLVESNPKKERLMSYVDCANEPMVHLNLLSENES
jgi:hypothetical protein